MGSLSDVNNPALRRLGQFSTSAPGVAGYGGPTFAVPTQFNIGGATQYGPDGKPLAPQYQQVGYSLGQPVTDATQQLNATYGQLGQFMQGAGSGQSAATLAQSAAMDQQQQIAMQNAIGQLKEKGFTGAATAGGMGNLAAMAAAQSAGDFARQKAGLLESERQAALQAAGLQGQLSGTLGNLGLGASGQQLQAAMANQDAALRAAQLAQQGDIAGAELALKGTGLSIDQAANIAKINQGADIANQGASLQAQGLNLSALTSAAGLTADQQRAIANLQSQTPEMQALNAYLQYGGLVAPQMGGRGGRSYGAIGNIVQSVAQGAGEEYGKQLVS